MRTLLIEPTSTDTAGSTLIEHLTEAGHEVVRCHPVDGPSFPCDALTDVGCPLEGTRPIDVAVATANEPSVTCAVRIGIPVVAVGAEAIEPLQAWAEPCEPQAGALAADLDAACVRAVAAAAERRGAPMRDEARRVLATEGVDAGRVEVRVARDGDVAHVVVCTELPVSERVAGIIATRVHAVDQEGTWPTTKSSVAIARL